MPKIFTRTIEDFQCKNCGARVKGDGYTNHCPLCLCSLHVDVNPGDRACNCCGLMRPAGMETKGGETIIVHRCEKCGFTRRNRASGADDFEQILRLVKNEG